MTKKDWGRACESFASFVQTKAQIGGESLRDFLAEADRLMRSAPRDQRAAYQELREADIQSSAEIHAKEVENHGMHWPNGKYQQNRVLLDLAIQIRTLDELLRDYSASVHALRRSPEAHWMDQAGLSYVIPTRRPRVPEMAKGDGDRAGYDKRGTLHHRVISTTIEGLSVKLHVPRTLRAMTAPAPLVGGGAAFPDLALDYADREGRFEVTGVRCKKMDELVKEQVAAVAACDFAVWPELTVDDDLLALIRQALKHEGLRRDTGHGLIVAGSWHRVDEDGVRRNRAPVLDALGRCICWFSKIAIYGERDAGFEDATGGEEIVVLVFEDFIASVCICKDFSDLQERNVWAMLPVDVVLVASMGDAKTMDGHLIRATELSKGHRRRAFVVQQGLWNFHDEPTNFLLRAPEHVPRDVAETHFCEPYSLCKIED
ncbi:hypothetical protein [Novosphingopyxis sp.]|uniref:hypothetical protein n=1 Tax=Novosphingopyxis sp. TaxID=2709690 RepID=UPI003B5BACC7